MNTQLLSLSTNFLLLLIVFLTLPNSVYSFRANAANREIAIRGGAIPNDESPSTLPTTMTTMTTALSLASSDDSEKSVHSMNNNLSVGFLGCGTIASSIARGLAKACQQQQQQDEEEDDNNSNLFIERMIVSERSESKSKSLVDDLTSKSISISRTKNNQEILNACDLIFLTVLPQQASEVLSSLEFDPNRHVLVSLVSTANLQDLEKDSKLDHSRVAKMICLPSIANHEGVALLCCGQTHGSTRTLLRNLFDATGGVVCLDTEADLEACMVTTCTMGPLYGTMKNQRDWLLKKTSSLSKEDATTLVAKQFTGAVLDALKNTHEHRFEELIDEQTPGGLNEQALLNYGTVLDGFESIQEPVMDAILSRIRGETDGSIEGN